MIKRNFNEVYEKVVARCFDTLKFIEQLNEFSSEEQCILLQKFMDKFNSYADFEMLLKWAFENENKEAVQIILSEPNIRIKISTSNPLIFAASSDFFQDVKVLLKYESFNDMTVNLALIFACMKRNFEVIKILAKDKRVDLSWGLIFAKKAYDSKVIKFLKNELKNEEN